MGEKKFVERRKYVRFDVKTKVHFQVKEKKKGEVPSEKISGISKDISVEGICFTSERKLEVGTKLKLEIFLPSESKPLRLEGEVRWIHPIQSEEGKVTFDTGVKLFTVDKGDENKFVGYVCKKMTEDLSRYLHL